MMVVGENSASLDFPKTGFPPIDDGVISDFNRFGLSPLPSVSNGILLGQPQGMRVVQRVMEGPLGRVIVIHQLAQRRLPIIAHRPC